MPPGADAALHGQEVLGGAGGEQLRLIEVPPLVALVLLVLLGAPGWSGLVDRGHGVALLRLGWWVRRRIGGGWEWFGIELLHNGSRDVVGIRAVAGCAGHVRVPEQGQDGLP